MVLGGEDFEDDEIGAPAWLKAVGSELKKGGTAAARGAAGAGMAYVGQRLTDASGKTVPPEPPPAPEGIPKGLLIAGSIVVGVGVLAFVATRGRSRPQVSNPRRRRRRRRGRR